MAAGVVTSPHHDAYGYPYPSAELEDEYVPNVDRILGVCVIEATVLEWLVSPGDQAERNQPLVGG